MIVVLLECSSANWIRRSTKSRKLCYRWRPDHAHRLICFDFRLPGQCPYHRGGKQGQETKEGSVAKNILATFHSSDKLAGATTSCMVSEFLQQIRFGERHGTKA